MVNCTSDGQCPATLVCYETPQWSPNRNFCGCESWYGWSGSDCLALSSGSRILLASAFLSGLLALAALVLSVEQLKRTLGNMRSTRYRINTAAVTLSMLIISLLSLFSWRINLIVMILTPQANTVIASSNGAVLKVHQFLIAERALVGIAVLCLCCALLEVSLVWLEISEGSLPAENVVRAQKYRYVITCFQLFWALLYIICASLGEIALMTFLTLPILFFVLLSYCFANRMMHRNLGPLIELTRAAENNLKKTIKAIKLTARRVVVSGSLAIFGAGIYVVLTLPLNYRDIIGPDDWVNAAAFFSEFIPCGVVGCCFALLANLYETKSKTSLVYNIRKWSKVATTRAGSFTARSEALSKSKLNHNSDKDVEEKESVNGITL